VNRAPNGPWVTVLGMHRSGTSALTGALGAAGFQLYRPDDRVDWAESNPEHWESRTLTVYNEDLLIRLDGGWDAPPEMPSGWSEGLELPDALDPVAALDTAYPRQGPSVWKDPRLCLLLPFWRDLLEPLAAVLVWRSPLAVAKSLLRRDGIPLPDGLALWERYNRSALTALTGVDTYVLGYESVIEDPVSTLDALLEWLGSRPALSGAAHTWEIEAAIASISRELRHHSATSEQSAAAPMLAEQTRLADHLSSLQGGHQLLLADLPFEESPWTTAVLRLRRKLSAPNRELARALEANRDLGDHLEITLRELTNLKTSTSWRMTGPVRAVSARMARTRKPSSE
jgi:hypothetical protein